MYDENQLVEMQWRNNTRKYYESKGYTFTNYGDSFYVKAKDLSSGARAKIQIVCDFCGKPTYPTFINYNKRKNKTVDACNNCKVKKQWSNSLVKRAKEKFDLLRKVCEENDYELLTDESEYTGVYMDIEYICKKHGYQCQTLENILHGHGCFSCSYETRFDTQRHSTEYVKNVIESFNGNKLLNPEDYINALTKNLIILCGSCGDAYITSFDAYVSKNKIMCFSCSNKESKAEIRIREFLENNDVQFIQEKRFDDCRDIHCLPFDFYLPDYNTIIEFDGQHHYFPTYGLDSHIRTVKHDKMKNEYCKHNNIRLIRIPYWEGNDIEHIIAKELNIDL